MVIIITDSRSRASASAGQWKELPATPGASLLGDGRKNSAIHRRRLHPGDADSRRGAFHFPCADDRQPAAALTVVALVFIAANLAVGIHFFHARAKSAAGSADGIFASSCRRSCSRVSCSPSVACRSGRMCGRRCALRRTRISSDRARNPPEGKWPRRNRPRTLAAAAFPRRRHDHRCETLPADAGIKQPSRLALQGIW